MTFTAILTPRSKWTLRPCCRW